MGQTMTTWYHGGAFKGHLWPFWSDFSSQSKRMEFGAASFFGHYRFQQVFKKLLINYHILGGKTFWLRQEPKERGCCACVRLSVCPFVRLSVCLFVCFSGIFCKITVKMSSRSILKSPGGSRASKQASMQACKQACTRRAFSRSHALEGLVD